MVTFDKDFLLQKLKDNATAMDVIMTKIDFLSKKQRLNDDEIDHLETLYREEFKLAMNNSGIYEDLIEALKEESDFTRRRYTQEANNFLKVKVIDI